MISVLPYRRFYVPLRPRAAGGGRAIVNVSGRIPPPHLRPRHRRGDRTSLPSAWGIGADRCRAAFVAQIIDIDALVALGRR